MEEIDMTFHGSNSVAGVPSARSQVDPEGVSLRLRSLSQRPTSITVSELIERYMAQYNGQDGSRAHRLAAWQEMIGDFEVSQVDADLIHAGRSELATKPPLVFVGVDHQGRQIFKVKGRQRQKSGATLNRYVQAIASVFTWAIEQRLTPKGFVHPCRGLKRMGESDGRVRYLDTDERSRLFLACRVSKYPRLYALVLMAMKTGARKGELLGLTWRDVDLEAGLAYLGRTKNGDRRTLVLLPDVVEALRPFVSTDPARFVFGSVRSKYLEPARIDTAWREAVARAKLRNFRFHDLRHCCASYMAQAGVPLNVVAEVLGHRKLDMTRRYAHLTVQTKAAAMAQALGAI
ncbi:tyrosine-type recombinase/integrase [Tepidimonas aquatica]|nr:site-specific integrase [Tepidimonas aquatica]